jgi:hypothetical protein
VSPALAASGLAAAAAGAWLAAALMLPPETVVPAPPAPLPAPAQAASEVPAAPTHAALAAALARPPFAPDRRPPSPATAAADASSPVALPTVVAIALSGDRAIALLRLAPDARPMRVRAGERVGPWLVEEIGRGHVVLLGSDAVRRTLPAPNIRPPHTPMPPPRVQEATRANSI